MAEQSVLYADKHLRVTLSAEDSTVVLSGEVDVSNSAALAAALADVKDANRRIEIDAGDLRFIDLSGLRVLLAAGCGSGDSVRLRNVPPYLERLLELFRH